METRVLFDRLLQMRDISRWAWDDPAYNLIVETAVLSAFIDSKILEEIPEIGDYWRVQAHVLEEPRRRKSIRDKLSRFATVSAKNDAAARGVIAALRPLISSFEGEQEGTRLPSLRSALEVDERLKARAMELAKATGELSRVDIHTLAHLDTASDRVLETSLDADQYAMLTSWALLEDGEWLRNVDLDQLRHESARAEREPLRYNWRIEKNSMFVVLRAFSLHGFLQVRQTRDERGNERKLAFAIAQDWGVSRGIALPQTGTVKAVIMPKNMDSEAIEHAVRAVIDEVLDQ